MNGLADNRITSGPVLAPTAPRALQLGEVYHLGFESMEKCSDESILRNLPADAHLQATAILQGVKPSLTPTQLKGLLVAHGSF